MLSLRKLSILLQPVFLLGLGLLLANDFLFKAAFHNGFTGKLSDFAGLFVFAVFWAAVFPRHWKAVIGLTALFFIFWKSAYSQGLVDWWSLNCWEISRVEDLTDLWALTVLPFAGWFFVRKNPAVQVSQSRGRLRPVLPAGVAVLSLFAFVATSQGPPYYVHTYQYPEVIIAPGQDVMAELRKLDASWAESRVADSVFFGPYGVGKRIDSTQYYIWAGVRLDTSGPLTVVNIRSDLAYYSKKQIPARIDSIIYARVHKHILDPLRKAFPDAPHANQRFSNGGILNFVNDKGQKQGSWWIENKGRAQKGSDRRIGAFKYRIGYHYGELHGSYTFLDADSTSIQGSYEHNKRDKEWEIIRPSLGRGYEGKKTKLYFDQGKLLKFELYNQEEKIQEDEGFLEKHHKSSAGLVLWIALGIGLINLVIVIFRKLKRATQRGLGLERASDLFFILNIGVNVLIWIPALILFFSLSRNWEVIADPTDFGLSLIPYIMVLGVLHYIGVAFRAYRIRLDAPGGWSMALQYLVIMTCYFVAVNQMEFLTKLSGL